MEEVAMEEKFTLLVTDCQRATNFELFLFFQLTASVNFFKLWEEVFVLLAIQTSLFQVSQGT